MDLVHFMRQNFSNIFVSEADRFDQNIAKGGEGKKIVYSFESCRFDQRGDDLNCILLRIF